MAFTSHGHHIKGSDKNNEPTTKARCGGPTICRKCSIEASEYVNQLEAESKLKVENPPEKKSTIILDPQLYARNLVLGHVSKRGLDCTDGENLLDLDGVYVVWFSKTLQNWKALVSTTLIDGRYYEVTHNGDKEETYLDVYVKIDNIAVPQNPITESVNN